MLKYFCCDEQRRTKVKAHGLLNGIDFLEVYDQGYDKNNPDLLQQRLLYVHFLKRIAADSLTTENIVVEGGERIRDLKVTRAEIVDEETLSPVVSPHLSESFVLVVELTEPGDFTTYRLRLVHGSSSDVPPDGFDPILSAVDFSFKVACPGDFDCEEQKACPPVKRYEPEINYLAKDFASFRQLMFDRLSVVAPEWRSRNPADLGVAFVEILAYVGDYLSYQQDAIATEAYLRTARKRPSVRRHVRLVDYYMHDGGNARVWVHLKVRFDVTKLELSRSQDEQSPTKFFTRLGEKRAELESVLKIGEKPYETALAAEPEVFELLEGAILRSEHNEMSFYTWDHSECCLPKGAVRATLYGSFPHLNPGDVLVFQEVKGPSTGKSADANPAHRHAVRLISANISHDPLGDDVTSPPAIGNPPAPAIPVTEIEWHPEDALPFPLCISSRSGESFNDHVSVALGNVVLADHGITIEKAEFDSQNELDPLKPQVLEPVPEANPVLTKVSHTPACHCNESDEPLTPVRYRPQLPKSPFPENIKNRPLTHAEPFKTRPVDYSYDPKNPPPSATASVRQSAEAIAPVVTLTEKNEIDKWEPVRDLLNSSGQDKEFVVEIENDGTTLLRFGDDTYGSRPKSSSDGKPTLTARYRAGNGTVGNVGADSLRHIASSISSIVSDTKDPVITMVTNPLPAFGGTAPETLEEVRQNAPAAFYTQERAVTLDDYVQRAYECDAGLQSAATTSRWTGSWHTTFLTVDRLKGKVADVAYEVELRDCLEKYRMAGHDLEVDLPRDVPLELAMTICVDPDYFRSDVKGALLDRFSDRVLPDDTKGIFHPDKFSLGDPVYISPIYEAAQEIEGVASVLITTFRRMGEQAPGESDQTEPVDALPDGKIELDRLEVARLDNNPNFPERGNFELKLIGGK